MLCAACSTSAFRHGHDPTTPSFTVRFLPQKGRLSILRSQAWFTLPLCRASRKVMCRLAWPHSASQGGTPRPVPSQLHLVAQSALGSCISPGTQGQILLPIPLSLCPVSLEGTQPQKHSKGAFRWDRVGKTTEEATGQRDNISHRYKAQVAAHRQLLPQPARKSWKEHYAAQALGPWLFLLHITTSKC